MSKPSLSEISKQLEALIPLRGSVARPQKLAIVNSRLYWLEGMTQELFYIELNDAASSSVSATPIRAIVEKEMADNAEATIAAAPRKLTKEEELLRERQRTVVEGISWFRVRPSGDVISFVTGLQLHLYSVTHKRILRVLDFVDSSRKLALFASEAPVLTNIQPMQENCTSFTFVVSANLYRLSIDKEAFESGQLEVTIDPITTFGKENSEFGTADYIMQEEFSRYSGHVVRDDRVLLLHTDTTVLRSISIAADNGEVESFPFPRVGDPNALSAVGVFDISTKTLKSVPHSALEEQFQTVFPDYSIEYITRFGFVDHNHFYLQLLDRRQERCMILQVAIDQLLHVTEAQIPRSNAFHNENKSMSLSAFEVLWVQSIPTAWCDVNDALFLGTDKQLIGAHIVSDKPDETFFHLHTKVGGSAAQWIPFTSGAWNVKAVSVVQRERRVYFEANVADRLGNELYSIHATSTDTQRAGLQLLSLPDERVHSFVVDPTEKWIAYVSSTANSLASLKVIELNPDGQRVAQCEVKLDWGLKNNIDLTSSIVLPKIITYKNERGVDISGALFLPPSATAADPATTIPLMMYVYGGPHVQLVYSNAMELACNPVVQALTRCGVAAVIVDNQMSNVNNLNHLSICKKNMGRFETADYVSFKQQLCKEYAGIIDPQRVGVFGWSYGGYATLLCMSQAAQEFKLGFSGAPVGDWRLYDTAYTERYMGLTEEVSYEEGQISRFAEGFPDEFDRVYIAHGLLDENVHFSHSCHIINALVAHSKPYQLAVYPGERHGLRQKKQSRFYYDTMLIKTVVERL